MTNNNNFQKPVTGSARMIGDGMQSLNKEVSIEINTIMTDIVNLAKVALHTAQERSAALSV